MSAVSPTSAPARTDDSVLGLVTANVPIAGPHETAAQIRARLVGHRYDTLADIPVVSDDGLLGLIAIESLLAAPPDQPGSELMDTEPPVVSPGVDQEVAAWAMVQHGESSLAVVGPDGTFHGIVPPNRIMHVLLWEHEEDLSRLAGVVHDADAVRSHTMESVPRRVRHRLPWLLVGLAGAMVAALLMSSFEESISAQVILVFFLPGVIYMADAVGTQTETVVVRGLSVGVPVGGVARREAWTGLIIGAVVAALFVPLGWLFFGDLHVMLAVGLALFASCAVASIVAMVLPYLLARMGHDPAYGSGPLATVIQDLLSIACYGLIVVTLV